MATITNPQAIRFSNEQIRTLADAYATLYFTCKRVGAAWTAQGIGSLIPNTADLLADGSDLDGRAAITGAKVNGLVNAGAALIADLEAASSLKLNILLQIAVNAR
jgi:hypothetical protein